MLNKELLLTVSSGIISIEDTISIAKNSEAIGRYFEGEGNKIIPWFVDEKGANPNTSIWYSSYHEDALFLLNARVPSMTGWHRIILGDPINASSLWIPIIEGIDTLEVGRLKYRGDAAWTPIKRNANTLCQWFVDGFPEEEELYYTQPPHSLFYNLYDSLGNGTIYMNVIFQFSSTPQT